MKRVDDNGVSMIICFLLPSKTGAQEKSLLGRKEGREVKPGSHAWEENLDAGEALYLSPTWKRL